MFHDVSPSLLIHWMSHACRGVRFKKQTSSLELGSDVENNKEQKLLDQETMQFCPTCGNILLIDGSKQYSTVNRLFCRTCPYHIEVNRTIKRKIIPKQKQLDEILEDLAWGATTEVKCAQCGHTKAYLKEMQTRSADEPATLFFKCENAQCGFQWKEG